MAKIVRLFAAAAALALAPASAHAQGVPVIDPTNIAQTLKTAQQAMQQVAQLKEQLSQLQSLQKTVGSIGQSALGNILKGTGLDLSDPLNSITGQYKAATSGLLDALPSTDTFKSLGIDTNLLSSAKTNIQDGRTFAINAFYKAGAAAVDDVAKRKGLREAAMRDAATTGYAVAVYTKNDLSKSEDRLKTLSTQVSAATDLRGDVQGNSAIALAQLQVLTQQNALLASLLEVNSTHAMATDPTSPISK